VQQPTQNVTITKQGAFVFQDIQGPTNPLEVRALRNKIEHLKDELQNTAERRNSVANQLKDADIDARAGYQERLGLLDKRLYSIENEITLSVNQLAKSTPAALAGASTQEPNAEAIVERVMDDVVPLAAIFTVFVIFPVAMAISRWVWRRATALGAPRPAQIEAATQQRLDQLQQSVDTIAIEVERISESQRFLSRVMNERALPAGGEPVGAKRITSGGS
jgi:FtsZ-binding cell division protein ZapB